MRAPMPRIPRFAYGTDYGSFAPQPSYGAPSNNRTAGDFGDDSYYNMRPTGPMGATDRGSRFGAMAGGGGSGFAPPMPTFGGMKNPAMPGAPAPMAGPPAPSAPPPTPAPTGMTGFRPPAPPVPIQDWGGMAGHGPPPAPTGGFTPGTGFTPRPLGPLVDKGGVATHGGTGGSWQSFPGTMVNNTAGSGSAPGGVGIPAPPPVPWTVGPDGTATHGAQPATPTTATLPWTPPQPTIPAPPPAPPINTPQTSVYAPGHLEGTMGWAIDGQNPGFIGNPDNPWVANPNAYWEGDPAAGWLQPGNPGLGGDRWIYPMGPNGQPLPAAPYTPPGAPTGATSPGTPGYVPPAPVPTPTTPTTGGTPTGQAPGAPTPGGTAPLPGGTTPPGTGASGGPGVISYGPDAWQNMPSLQYLMGNLSQGDYLRGNANPTTSPTLGVTIPSLNSLNYGRLLDIYDAGGFDTLSSAFRSANRDLALEMALARMRAPVGSGVNSGLIGTGL